MFQANKLVMRDVDKIRNPPNQMIFVFADLAVGDGDLPHQTNQAAFFLRRAGLINHPCKVVERYRLLNLVGGIFTERR